MSALQHIPASRQSEHDALVRLLMGYADPADADAPAIAEWIARSAMEPEHLWRAMGVSSRAELRALFERHFPALAAENTRDMRWKKFLYKRLCGWSGFEG